MHARTRIGTGLLVVAAMCGCVLLGRAAVRAGRGERIPLHAVRRRVDDLAVSGRVKGWPAGAVGYVSREELMALPQVAAVIADDPDLPGITMHVHGVRLSVLERALGAERGVDLVDTPCSDGYRSYFPAEMIRAHEPLLVLTIDGMTPEVWAKSTKQEDPGPYLVLNEHFRPAWKVLAHEDRPQLPTNVVRVDFGTQAEAFARIAPGGGSVKDEQGYEIARQNCIRCHDAGSTGGTKSGVSWAELGEAARARPDWFARVVKDPQAVNAKATMPGNPEYDAATLDALTHYFGFLAEAEAR